MWYYILSWKPAITPILQNIDIILKHKYTFGLNCPRGSAAAGFWLLCNNLIFFVCVVIQYKVDDSKKRTKKKSMVGISVKYDLTTYHNMHCLTCIIIIFNAVIFNEMKFQNLVSDWIFVVTVLIFFIVRNIRWKTQLYSFGKDTSKKP